MTWILLATAAQFINAIVAILDKYIVTDEKILPRPFVYAFYSCLLAGVWVLVYLLSLFPLPQLGVPSFSNVESPTLIVVALSLLASYTFFIALVSMYTALKQADASDVLPVIGAVAALSSFGLGYQFLDQELSHNFIFGIFFLVAGTFLVSKMRFKASVAWSALHAGIFFSIHYIAMKGLFNETNFDNAFFWSRIGFVIFALTLLLVPEYYAKIREQKGVRGKKAGGLILVTKLLAGIAGIMLLKATDMGEVSVVQALDGLKFVFILIIGMAVGHVTPSSCGEDSCRRKEVIQKALFVAIISIGFLILFL